MPILKDHPDTAISLPQLQSSDSLLAPHSNFGFSGFGGELAPGVSNRPVRCTSIFVRRSLKAGSARSQKRALAALGLVAMTASTGETQAIHPSLAETVRVGAQAKPVHFGPMTWLKGVILLYAVIDIVDGVEGYIALGKLPWLVWNAGFGAMVIGGLVLSNRRAKLGYAICALFAGLDTVFFGRKLIMTPAVWPAGVTTVLAVCALACAGFGMISARGGAKDSAANPN